MRDTNRSDIKCISFGLAVICFVLLGIIPAGAASHREKIAVVVNDDIITTTDIETRLLLNTGGRAVPPSQHRKAVDVVLDELINETLQRQSAEALSITVDEQQVREAFSAVAQKNGMTPDQFRTELKQAGVPVEVLYDKLETDIAWAQVVRRKLRPKVAVSENDIDAIFDTRARSEGQTQYRLAEIFIATNSGKDKSAAKTRMNEILKLLKSGARFSEVARQYSQSPGASRGGDLGWMTFEQMEESFQPRVLKMKPGQLNGPFETAEGYHLLLMVDRKLPETAAVKPKRQKDKTVTKLHLQQIFLPVKADEPEALKNAKMVRAQALKDEVSDCAGMAKRGADFDSPLTGDLGLVGLSDLPPQVAEEVNALKIGELSRPMVNDKGIFVLMVCDRIASVSETAQAEIPADGRDDEAAREQIANTLGLKKLDAMQQRYLQDLRSAAFIDVRI